MIKKQDYLAPEAERIDIGFEACILSSTDTNVSGTAGNDLVENDDYKYSF